MQANRWRKRGINMMPLRFSLHWDGATPYTVLVSIYAEDGTVAVSHGGVEIGQGINTKVSLSLPTPTSPPPLFISPLPLFLSLHPPSPSLPLSQYMTKQIRHSSPY